MAIRSHLDSPVVNARDLLVYRVLLRDQPAIVDLVSSVLSPLVQAQVAPSHCWPRWTPTSAPVRWPPSRPNGCTCPYALSPIDSPASRP
jgi:hypothetical protein